jgi:hypothetical protein
MNSSQLINENKEFSQYARHILLAIKEALTKSDLTEIQTLAIFIQLSKARSKSELKEIIILLTKKYPVLKEIEFYEKEESQLDFDNTLQIIISSLIKDGKAKEADELSKKSSSYERNVDLLVQDYKQYFYPSYND